MLLVMLVSVSVAGAPTLASPDFSVVNVKPEVAAFCNEHLAQALGAHGVKVTTARQIAALLGFERQKQLLGCGEGASACMAELGAALGVDGLLLGDLGRLGSKYQLNVRVLKSGTNDVVASFSRTVDREEALLDAVQDAADALSERLLGTLGPQPAPRVRKWPLVPTVLTGVFGVASAVTYGFALDAHTTLLDPNAAPGSIADMRATDLATRGEVLQRVAFGTLVAAAVSLGVCVVMYLISGQPPSPQALLVPWTSSVGWAR